MGGTDGARPSPMLRVALAVTLLGACATEPPTVATDLPDPLEEVLADSVHSGDLVVLVPGTASYDFLGATIDALPGERPRVDVRAFTKVADDAIVIEQAIAAAHRAGIPNAELESGAVTFGLWGAGFTRVTAFDYVSYEGLTIPIVVLGGKNSCAVGRVVDNLLNYSIQNAENDARNLYLDVQRWVTAHPTPSITIASHSWGGAIAEYLTLHLETIAARSAPLGPIAPIHLTIAAGVPGYVPGYSFAGPGLRDLEHGALYEIDRPDDPVHAMNPSGNPDGHQYDILAGDAYLGTYLGAYGVTTMEISCRGAPGECPLPPP